MLPENGSRQQTPLILDNKPGCGHCYSIFRTKRQAVLNNIMTDTGVRVMLSNLMKIARFATLVAMTLVPIAPAHALDAAAIIKAAMDQWRGTTSHSTMSMTIHRPDWERTMVMEGWTAGEKKSLVRVLEPKKDAGNGTLLIDNNMWTFSPKVNRVIKIPSSMMNQSWMGSDFSNKDIARPPTKKVTSLPI